MRPAQYYCNKCGYFGEGQQHARPGTESLCDYTAYETKESSEFRQLEAMLASAEADLANEREERRDSAKVLQGMIDALATAGVSGGGVSMAEQVVRLLVEQRDAETTWKDIADEACK